MEPELQEYYDNDAGFAQFVQRHGVVAAMPDIKFHNTKPPISMPLSTSSHILMRDSPASFQFSDFRFVIRASEFLLLICAVCP